jgi:hypothetical protein
VEGAIDESTLADAVAQECDSLKKVPLGAQIIRCIGRAYRHSGQRVLRQYHRKSKSVLLHPLHVGAALSDNMRDKMRDAKQVVTAAIDRQRSLAFVMVGDVMVPCSKEGTAWMEVFRCLTCKSQCESSRARRSVPSCPCARGRREQKLKPHCHLRMHKTDCQSNVMRSELEEPWFWFAS